jgi:hypothetical protein
VQQARRSLFAAAQRQCCFIPVVAHTEKFQARQQQKKCYNFVLVDLANYQT